MTSSCATPPRGYSLVIVLLTLAILTISIVSLWVFLQSQIALTAETHKRRQVFYVCDGISRMVASLAGEYAKQASTASAEDFKAWLVAGDVSAGRPRLIDLTPAGYELREDDVVVHSLVRAESETNVPNGPFAGLPGRESRLDLSVKSRTTDTGDFACEVRQQLALAEVGLFQFALYSSAQNMRVAGSSVCASKPCTRITGRVHNNSAGPLVFGGEGLIDGVITSKGQNGMASSVGTNSASFPMSPPNSSWPTADNPFSPANSLDLVVGKRNEPLDLRVDRGAAATYKLADFDGRVIDGVADLAVPDVMDRSDEHYILYPGPNANKAPSYSKGPQVQATGDLRYLIAPVNPSGTFVSERARLAYKADLRIIDGVWYLRDPSNPLRLGTPIWSDHPGDKSSDDVVAQHDSAITATWGPDPPRRYSYYAATPDGRLLVDQPGPPQPRAVISYGGLTRAAPGQTEWEPGLYTNYNLALPNKEDDWSLCIANAIGLSSRSSDADIMAAIGPLAAFDDAARTVSALKPRCAGAVTAGAALLAAARVPQLLVAGERREDSDSQQRRAVQVMNFDVAALQEALADPSPGELGAHFRRRTFNGIVWLSATWPGKDDGVLAYDPPTADVATTKPTTTSQKFPLMAWGSAGPGTMTSSSGVPPWRVREEPPFPLCGVASAPAPHVDGGGLHEYVACAGTLGPDGRSVYETTATEAYGLRTTTMANGIGAVRVFNARNINASPGGTRPVVPPDQLPAGLTLVTDIAMVVLGDVNASSVPALTPEEIEDRVPWVPVLLAGDTLHMLGNSGVDGAVWIKDGKPGPLCATCPEPTREPLRIHAALLGGLMNGEGRAAETPPPITELAYTCDTGAVSHLTVAGSIVAGFNAVYGPLPQIVLNNNAPPSEVDIAFDHRMASLSRQPPGAASLSVTATRAWER